MTDISTVGNSYFKNRVGEEVAVALKSDITLAMKIEILLTK